MALDLEYIGGSSWLEKVRKNFETSVRHPIPAGRGWRAGQRLLYVTAGEETAGTLAIDTGLAAPVGFVVQILRAGAVATSDAAVSLSDSDLVIADGAAYSVTDGDAINWIAFS